MDADLSRDEAYTFLQNILKIQNPKSELTHKSKLDFLNLFIGNWLRTIPFQNVQQICLTNTENRLLTVPEVIQNELQGNGGMCIYNAIFCHCVLAALGFDVHFVASTIFIPRDHVVVVAKNIQEPGDSYLVEVGCGWPTFHAIPLDNMATDLDSCHIYFDNFLEYTYIREDDLVVRYHRKGDFLINPSKDFKNGWRKQSHIEMTPVSTEFLYSEECGIVKTIKDINGIETNLMLSLRIVFYPEMRFVAVSNGYLHFVVDGQRERKKISSKEEMFEVCRKYFPMVDLDLVDQAYEMTKDKRPFSG